MKAKEIKALESYFKTENEYWNSKTFDILNEVLKLDLPLDKIKEGSFSCVVINHFGKKVFQTTDSPIKSHSIFSKS
jgi:hypothetical protein